jgi:flagellar operon protein
MSERNTIANLYTGRIGPIIPKPVSDKNLSNNNGPSFQSILNGQLVKFSSHAELRLAQRGIQLQPEQVMKLGGAIDKAAAKGAKDSLVLFQDMAFIVNVKNRTVVTAMDGASMKEHVFTQIDSTVVIE